ncbi:MAG: hypothetical protein RR585_00435 [Coprobacillus sp.]
MKKQKKITMNIGIISFLTVFVILCLVTFAILSLASAKSNVNLNNKSIEHKEEYYKLCNQGETYLKQIDDQLYKNYNDSHSQSEYFSLINNVLNIDSSIKITDNIISFEIVQTNQKLHVQIEVLYPGEKLYQLKTWSISPSQEWTPDNKLNIL